MDAHSNPRRALKSAQEQENRRRRRNERDRARRAPETAEQRSERLRKREGWQLKPPRRKITADENKPAQKISCGCRIEMNGLHIPDTPIVVDFWKLRQIPPRPLCFLTHMHADHTSGLTSSWPYPIHCTPTTAKLLIRKFNINSKLVVELEVGDSRILHVNCPGSGEHVGITVTVLDANHCPGSAMFLFQGYFGSVLYTGDFRLSPSMMSHPVLNGSQTIDILYLDNTYCHPSCQFPSREDAAEQVVGLVRDNPELTTVIGMHTLGKEDLLVHIATTLECWVGVSQERYDMLKLLEQPNVFKTDMMSCAVQVYPFYQVAKDMPVGLDSDDLVQIILPTCLYIGTGAPGPPARQFTTVIPYSDHCSFSELWQFVTSVRPRCVRPIVRHFTGDRNTITLSRANMSIFDELLDPTPSSRYEVPESIQRILCMRACDHVPHPYPTINRPALRKCHSLTPPNSKTLRNRPRGVQFISPSKHKPTSSILAVQSDNQTSNLETRANSPPEDTVISRKMAEVLEECGDSMHEEEVWPSNLVNPHASLQQQTEECMTQVHFANSTIDSSKLLVGAEHESGTKTTATVENMPENADPKSIQRVEINPTEMEKHPLPKLASSDDLDLFYGSGLSRLGVKRKLPPSLHSSSNKAVLLSPGSQTPLTRFFSSALADATSESSPELLERLKSFDLKSPVVLNLLDSALQQAAQLMSTSPVASATATPSAPLFSEETEEEKEEEGKEEEEEEEEKEEEEEEEEEKEEEEEGGLGDLDAKLMGNSEAERQPTRCTCGETDSDEVCFVGLEKFFVRHDHQSLKDFERWLQNL